MPPCLMAKKASSDTDLMFQFYLPNYTFTAQPAARSSWQARIQSIHIRD